MSSQGPYRFRSITQPRILSFYHETNFYSRSNVSQGPWMADPTYQSPRSAAYYVCPTCGIVMVNRYFYLSLRQASMPNCITNRHTLSPIHHSCRKLNAISLRLKWRYLGRTFAAILVYLCASNTYRSSNLMRKLRLIELGTSMTT